MAFNKELYNSKLENLRIERDEQIASGELTAEEAWFRYEFLKDEILMCMED